MSISSSVQQFSAAIAAYMAGTIITSDEAGRLLHYDVVGYVAIAFSGFAFLAATRLRVTEGQSSHSTAR